MGRTRRRSEAGGRFERGFAAAIVLVTVPSQIYQIAPWNFSWSGSLPLALCDFAWIVAAWALWTRDPVPTALVYYWGLTLTSQAIVTPSLGDTLPDPRYFMFWSMHFPIVWSAVYLTFGLGLGPGWREYRITLLVTLVWAAVTYPVDVLVGANYGYLVRKPGSASLLDLLGPWPLYVVASLGVLAGGWAPITWPWVVKRAPAPS